MKTQIYAAPAVISYLHGNVEQGSTCYLCETLLHITIIQVQETRTIFLKA